MAPAVPFLEAVQDVSAGNAKIPQSQLLPAGSLAVVDQGQALVAGYIQDTSSAVKTDGPVIVFGDHTRAIKYVDFPFAMGADGVKVLRPRNGFDPKFVYRYLQSREIPPAGYSRHFKFLKEISVPKPSLDEQRRIAAILDHADALRTKRRQVLAHLDELKQSIFLTMFGHDREFRSVSELCELVVDCVNRTAPTVDGPTPYKMLRTTNVRNGAIDTTNVNYVEQDVFERWNRRATPRRGDVILTREAPVGEAGVLLSDDRVFLGQRLMLYRVDPSQLTSDYLAACFRSPILQEQFDRLGSGSTVKHLPLPACRSFAIPVAPIADQRHFSERVIAINDLRSAFHTQTTTEAGLFASLRSRAFKGTL